MIKYIIYYYVDDDQIAEKKSLVCYNQIKQYIQRFKFLFRIDRIIKLYY